MENEQIKVSLPQEGSAESSKLRYPSELRCMVAMLLDLVFVLVVFTIILSLVSAFLTTILGGLFGFLLDIALLVLVFWAYFTYLESSPLHATLGKKICGLMVVDLKGNSLDFRRASHRFWANALKWIRIIGGPISFLFEAPGEQEDTNEPLGTVIIESK